MAKYRKKPVVIEAFHFSRSDLAPADFPCWLKDAAKRQVIAAIGMDRIDFIAIYTLEGTMRADMGDWIIQGVKGELYPCRDDIFRITYEAVDAA